MTITWTFVWDLDGTLVKSTDYRPSKTIPSQPITFYSEIEDDYRTVWTSFRPGFINLLQELQQHEHQIGIWSAGQPGYVKAITEAIIQKAQIEPIFVYDWTRCERDQYRIYKPLRSCPTDQQRTLLIDDTIDIIDPHGHDDGRVVIVPRYNPKRPERGPILIDALEKMIGSLEQGDQIIAPQPLQYPRPNRHQPHHPN